MSAGEFITSLEPSSAQQDAREIVVPTELAALNPRFVRDGQKVLRVILGPTSDQEVIALTPVELQDQIFTHTAAYIETLQSPSQKRRAEIAQQQLQQHFLGLKDGDIALQTPTAGSAKKPSAKEVMQRRKDLIDGASKLAATTKTPEQRSETPIAAAKIAAQIVHTETILAPAVTLETELDTFSTRKQLSQNEAQALAERLSADQSNSKLTDYGMRALDTLGLAYQASQKEPGLLHALEREALERLTGTTLNQDAQKGLILKEPLWMLEQSMEGRLAAAQITARQVVALALAALNRANY